MMVMVEACLHGLSAVHVTNGFKNSGTWPVRTKVGVARLLTGTGATNAARLVYLRRLVVRLVPEARREMSELVQSVGPIPNRGRAVVATGDGVLKAIKDLEADKEAAWKAKEAKEARKVNACLARAAQVLANERDAERRRESPEFCRHKEARRSAAKRQKERLKSAGEYSPVRG